jgi:GNAT superfamily N-acetyltransferase
MHFVPVPFAEIRDAVVAHTLALSAPFDDFFETHITEANAYRIEIVGVTAGFATVHGDNALTQFHLHAPYRHMGRAVFQQARLLQQVTHASLPASDSFFLTHALDDYRMLEKQAYFFAQDVDLPAPVSTALTFTPARAADEAMVMAFSGDFLGEETGRVIQKDGLVLVHRAGELIGLGVCLPLILTPQRRGIGMFVAESHRRAGVGTEIIRWLMGRCAANGLQPVAGCWYYNHASRRTLHAAGMAAVNRWLKVHF